MREESYRKLAKHLDKLPLPDGFAPSDTGAELRLLQRFFTPQEAELATHLTLEREEAHVIAGRAGLPPSETEQQLNEMSKKGLIFSTQPEDGPILYQALPFFDGIYENQVNNFDAELVQDLADYWNTIEERPHVQTIPQMRTIPVGKSIKPHLESLPYEQVDELVKAYDQYAVTPCRCRRKANIKGIGCDAPEESCLFFGEYADYLARMGIGRSIDRSEVLDILSKANAANLVLRPSNAKDIEILCCCCGCCCTILAKLQSDPKPSEIVASAFIAKLDAAVCQQGCWVCAEERCQMQALAKDGDHVALNTDRCIGCGLCVSTCPSGALTLVRKSDSELTLPPDNKDALLRKIMQAQTERY